jgi:hypothetical protein
MPSYHYRPVTTACSACGTVSKDYRWLHERDAWVCACGGSLTEVEDQANRATAVIGDEVDYTFHHGLCNEDGTPRRYTSRTQIRQECIKRGWRNPGAVNGPF